MLFLQRPFYSESFHLVQKKTSALWSVRFMIVRFVETFL